MSNVEIRVLRPDEVDQFVDLSYYAFHALGGSTREQFAAGFRHQDIPERKALVAVENGTILSTVIIFSVGTWIRGVRYPTGAIANVATAPDRLRQGHARRLLVAALRVMREELGLSLSILYPTIYPLYNELGWTLVEDAHRYVGSPAVFQPSARLAQDSGGHTVHRPAALEDLAILAPLYQEFVQPRSGYLDRPRWHWAERLRPPHRSNEPRWLVLWYGSDDRPGAYALYTLNYTPQERLIRIDELIAPRPEGYHALLTYFSSHHIWDKIAFEDSHDIPWRLLVRDPHQLEIQTHPRNNHFLLRVVDLRRAIEAISVSRAVPPGGFADVKLRVEDRSAPWNDGTWSIGRRDAGWSCAPADNESPDASTDIATLAALVSGSISARQCRDVGLLRTTPEAMETLSALFASDYAPHSKDHF